MKNKFKNINICYAYLIALIPFCACTTKLETVKLYYHIKIDSIDSNISPAIKVDLKIDDIDINEIFLKGYEADKYLGLSDLKIFSQDGSILTYETINNSSTISYYISTKKNKRIDISYKIHPGTLIGDTHGRYPSAVSSYLGDDLGLLSGRNLFLVPDAFLDFIQVNIEVPNGWEIVTTWPEVSEGDLKLFYPRIYNNRGPEDLVNGVLGVGLFSSYEKMINETSVRVFTYSIWPESYRQKLAEKCFSLYKYITNVFGFPIQEPYSFIFTPPAPNNLPIKVAATSHGQGREMWPSTISRWIACTEEIAYRWLRYPPYRMEFKKLEDMWFVDGIAIYYALKAITAAGIITDLGNYLLEFYRNYNNSRLTYYQRNSFPSNFYKNQVGHLEVQLQQISAVFAHYFDGLIRNQTNNKKDLTTLLKIAYKRRYNLQLRNIFIEFIPESTVDKIFNNYIKPNSKPQHLLYNNKEVPGTQVVELPKKRGDFAVHDTITLILTGKTQSFLESCGCKVNQSGGVTRRATLIKQILKRRNNVAIIDAGNAFPDPKDVPFMNALTSCEINTYLEILARMNYSFSTITDNEIYYGLDFLKEKLSTSPIPLISANIYHKGKMISQPTISVKLGNYQIGFIGLTQKPLTIPNIRFEDNTFDIEIANLLKNIRAFLPSLKEQNDFIGIIGNLDTYTVYKIVEAFPEINLVITIGHPIQVIDVDIFDDQYVLQELDAMYGFLKNTLVLYANADVYGLHQFDIFINNGGYIVELEGNRLEAFQQIKEDIDIKNYLVDYYRSIAKKDILLTGQVEPLFSWDGTLKGTKYVGLEKCITCHSSQYKQWQTTRHAEAYAKLLDSHRHHYPKCVVCHVVGFGYSSGFDILKADRNLANIQCEICHGPGSSHVNQPLMQFMDKKRCKICHGLKLPHILKPLGEKLRHDVVEIFHRVENGKIRLSSNATIRKIPYRRVCLECHTPDHDDNFDYTRDIQLVSH